MNRKVLSAILLVSTFLAVYLILCFCIPGLRIKLEAEPGTFFLASIRHMAAFKFIISLLAGLAVGAIPLLIGKKK